MMKRFARKLAVLVREVPAILVRPLTNGNRALTPRQEAKLEEMEKDYAELMRTKGSKLQKTARQNNL